MRREYHYTGAYWFPEEPKDPLERWALMIAFPVRRENELSIVKIYKKKKQLKLVHTWIVGSTFYEVEYKQPIDPRYSSLSDGLILVAYAWYEVIDGSMNAKVWRRW